MRGEGLEGEASTKMGFHPTDLYTQGMQKHTAVYSIAAAQQLEKTDI